MLTVKGVEYNFHHFSAYPTIQQAFLLCVDIQYEHFSSCDQSEKPIALNRLALICSDSCLNWIILLFGLLFVFHIDLFSLFI